MGSSQCLKHFPVKVRCSLTNVGNQSIRVTQRVPGRGNFKTFHSSVPRIALKPRGVIALAMVIGGVALLIISVAYMIQSSEILDWIGIGVGALAVIVGIVFLMAELMERWLTHGQSALVDGLQAG